MVNLPDRQSVPGGLLARLAARVETMLLSRRWKKTAFAGGKVSAGTVRNVLNGKNCRVSTLVELADALDCDLVIDLQPRVQDAQAQTDTQHIAHDI